MAGRIRDTDVALVRERSPIDRVVGEHVQLRSAGGGSLKGLCPFHDERSPSFQVTPSRGLYYCFGCGKGGDVIDFVRSIEHLSFTEAVEGLAAKVGVLLTYEGGGSSVRGAERGQRQRLVEAHAAAAAFYAGHLATDTDAEPGRAFLAERGFDAAAAERFGVGCAPSGWDALAGHLTRAGFTRDELVTAGLAKVSARGTLIDRFRGRLVWPIRTLPGDTVGFGARRLHEDDQGPKYLNTPETPLFKKSELLYGLDLAKAEIAKGRQVVVVEGYTDVMACHLAGVATAVATCGTSCGAAHTRVLRPLLDDGTGGHRGAVIFTFDGDAAGQKAALRAAELDDRVTASTYVAVAPGGQDPCELRLSAGDEAVRSLAATRTPLYAFVMRAQAAGFDLDSNEGRLAALDATLPTLLAIKDRALRTSYAGELAKIIGYEDAEPVRARAVALQRRTRAGAGGAGGPSSEPAEPTVDARQRLVEREALKAVVQEPACCVAVDTLPDEVFLAAAHRGVLAAVRAVGGPTAATGGGPAWVAALRAAAPDDTARELVVALAVEPLRVAEEDPVVVRRYCAAVLARVEALAVGRAVAAAKSRLLRTDPGDPSYGALFQDLLALEARARRLSDEGVSTAA